MFNYRYLRADSINYFQTVLLDIDEGGIGTLN